MSWGKIKIRPTDAYFSKALRKKEDTDARNAEHFIPKAKDYQFLTSMAEEMRMCGLTRIIATYWILGVINTLKKLRMNTEIINLKKWGRKNLTH